MIDHIKIEYSDAGMWGNDSPDAYDIEASYAKFEQMVSSALQKEYPGAEIEIFNGINDKYQAHDTESGWLDGSDTEDIASVVGRVWQGQKWAVEGSRS